MFFRNKLGIAVLVAGLTLAAAAFGQRGEMNCSIGSNGMMLCGMDMSSPHSQALTTTAAHPLKIAATMASPATTGDNPLNIVITNAAGKPITAAKVTAEVAMTSMNMGTDEPAVKEIGKGRYAATIAFSMAGPWRVTLRVVAPRQKPQSKSFDFTAN